MTKTLVLGKQTVALTINEVIRRYETSNQAEGKSPRTIAWYTEILMSFSNYMEKELQCHDLSAFNVDTVRNYLIHLRNQPTFQGHPSTLQPNTFHSPVTLQYHSRAL